MEKIANNLIKTDFATGSYADGIVLICTFEDIICDRIQLGLRITNNWWRRARRNHSLERTRIHLKAIRLHGIEVNQETEVKHLEIT